MADETTYKYIIKYGTYYFPAEKHYQDYRYQLVVQCDRCRRDRLTSCLGWENYDLCMECVPQVERMILRSQMVPQSPQDTFKTLMVQDQFKYKTKMRQSQFDSRACVTNMEQSQFKAQVRTRMEQEQYATKMIQDQFNK